MPTIVNEKLAGSGYNLFDFVAIGVNKRVTEALLQPVVGNGTLKSGLIKGAAGLGMEYFRPRGAGIINKELEWMEAGLIIDAVEDITLTFLGPNPLGTLMGQPNASSTEGFVFI